MTITTIVGYAAGATVGLVLLGILAWIDMLKTEILRVQAQQEDLHFEIMDIRHTVERMAKEAVR